MNTRRTLVYLRVLFGIVCIMLSIVEANFIGFAEDSILSSSVQIKSSYAIFSNVGLNSSSPFHDAVYESYNSYARDNGLGGDMLHLYGKITFVEVLKDTLTEFILEQEDGRKWCVSCGIITDAVDLCKEESVEIYCQYGGFSDLYDLPSVSISTHGGIYKNATAEYIVIWPAVLNMTDDGFYIDNKSSDDQSNEKAVENDSDKEILFREIPWGTSYIDVTKEFNGMRINDFKGGASWYNWDIDQICTGKSKEKYKYDYINMSAIIYDTIEVAGYKTKETDLFFAYLPGEDGILTHEYSDTAFYGARYIFNPADIDNMEKDLKNKLVSTYGEIDVELEPWNGMLQNCTAYRWIGPNDTSVVLTVRRSSSSNALIKDEIWISYFTLKGNDWLEKADNAEQRKYVLEEQQATNSGDKSGL